MTEQQEILRAFRSLKPHTKRFGDLEVTLSEKGLDVFIGEEFKIFFTALGTEGLRKWLNENLEDKLDG